MESDNLIRMANSIGDFFESMPDRDEALEGIAMHIRKFWVPDMRSRLLATLQAGEHEASDIVVQAIERHCATWPEAAGRRRT